MRVQLVLTAYMTALSLQGASQEASPFECKPTKAPMVVILGAATAAGVGASSYELSWAGRLSSLLRQHGVTVVNRSIPGSSTADSLERFDSDVVPLRPQYVILATQMFNEKVPAEEAADPYVNNMRELIRRVETLGAVPIIVGPYPSSHCTPRIRTRLNGVYSELADEGAPVLDFLSAVDDGQCAWISGVSMDGLHPNDRGHEALFDSIPVDYFSETSRPSAFLLNATGRGSWVQLSDKDDGRIDITPVNSVNSWTLSFWIASGEGERVFAAVNGWYLQLRFSGGKLLLYNDSELLAAADVPVGTGTHIALTYRDLTGKTGLYVAGRRVAEANILRREPARTFSIGGSPEAYGYSALGTRFADVVLYRTPLDAETIRSIYELHLPRRSVEAFLPLTYNPNRQPLNLAATSACIRVLGSWRLTPDEIRH